MIQKGVASPYLESILCCVRLCLALTKQEDIVSSRVTGTIEATFVIYFLPKGDYIEFLRHGHTSTNFFLLSERRFTQYEM